MAETTFKNFTPEQAAAYAKGRGFSYPLVLYDTVLGYHTADPRAQKDLLLDVGCGPGKVAFDLLSRFTRSVGLDAGRGMIEAARADPRFAEAGGRARFEVCGAEDCASVEGLAGAVDCITVAMAAHWFDMDAFYASAAKVLRPGGTLAMWTCSSMYAHPADPHHAELQAILAHLEDDILVPYLTPGNQLSREGYNDLPLPWLLPAASGFFSKSSFVRKDWNLNGVPSSVTQADGQPGPFLFGEEATPAQLGKILNSASMVIRWREAHKSEVDSGELEDCVAMTVRALENALADRPSGRFSVAPSCTLLMLRRV